MHFRETYQTHTNKLPISQAHYRILDSCGLAIPFIDVLDEEPIVKIFRPGNKRDGKQDTGNHLKIICDEDLTAKDDAMLIKAGRKYLKDIEEGAKKTLKTVYPGIDLSMYFND